MKTLLLITLSALLNTTNIGVVENENYISNLNGTGYYIEDNTILQLQEGDVTVEVLGNIFVIDNISE